MAFGKGGQAQAATFVVDLVLLQIKVHVHFSRNSIHHSLDVLLSYIYYLYIYILTSGEGRRENGLCRSHNLGFSFNAMFGSVAN